MLKMKEKRNSQHYWLNLNELVKKGELL